MTMTMGEDREKGGVVYYNSLFLYYFLLIFYIIVKERRIIRETSPKGPVNAHSLALFSIIQLTLIIYPRD